MVSDRARLDGFLQGARSLQLLGLHHILLLSLTEEECAKIAEAVPEVGCGWTEFENPQDMWVVFKMWNLRYRTVSRSDHNVVLLLLAQSICKISKARWSGPVPSKLLAITHRCSAALTILHLSITGQSDLATTPSCWMRMSQFLMTLTSTSSSRHSKA